MGNIQKRLHSGRFSYRYEPNSREADNQDDRKFRGEDHEHKISCEKDDEDEVKDTERDCGDKLNDNKEGNVNEVRDGERDVEIQLKGDNDKKKDSENDDKNQLKDAKEDNADKVNDDEKNENKDGGSSNAMNNDKLTRAENKNTRNESESFVEFCRETHCKVDADIMAFIMSSNYAEALEKQLATLGAEIEWPAGRSVAKIRQKEDSDYIKRWASRCQAVVCEFLDRCEKFSVPLESALVRAMHDALPRLNKTLRSDRAICMKREGKEELVVVCLDEVRQDVSSMVSEFLEVVKKEVLSTKETIENINPGRIRLLQQIGFVEQLSAKYSEMQVNLDVENCKLYFEGPRDKLEGVKTMYDEVMKDIYQMSFSLSSSTTGFGNILKSELGQNYFREELARESILALFFVEDSQLEIVAANRNACQRARDCLLQITRKETVTFALDDLSLVEGSKCKEMFKKMTQGQLLNIFIEKSSDLEARIVLVGLEDRVLDAKRQIDSFIATERTQNERQEIQEERAQLLNRHLSEKVKDIEKRLEHARVSIQIYEGSGTVLFKGTSEGIKKCKELFSELCAELVSRQETYSSPGSAMLLLGEQGRDRVKVIELDRQVVITMNGKLSRSFSVTPRARTRPLRRQSSLRVKNECVFEELLRERPRSELPRPKNDVFDLCNFTSKNGLSVSWAYGNIEKQKVDVLVNSATSNLNYPTACGKALNTAGGPDLVKACKPLTNISSGDIACTTGGSLSCKHVIHAVCCDWDGGKGRAEKLLRDLLGKILNKCVELCAFTVALPTIGTGLHNFPEKVFFQVLREETEKFCNTSSSRILLREIRVIVFESKRPTAKQPSQAKISSSPCYRVVNSRSVKFDQVCVSVNEGDITQQSSPVEAIINVLPSDLKLSKGGGVCKSILKVGGQTVQKQLDDFGKCLPGSVVVTSAGSIRNTNNIIHFVPTSTDVPGIQDAIEKCLNKAMLLQLKSVSVSAIGTALFSISPRKSAELILNASKRFSQTGYQLEVKIVVFQKSMVPEFETALLGETKAAAKPAGNPSFGPVPTQAESIQEKSSRSEGRKSLRTKNSSETVILNFFGGSKQDVDAACDDVCEFIRRKTGSKVVEHEHAQAALQKNWAKIKNLAAVHDVNIECSSPDAVTIKGMGKDVSECKDILSHWITSYAEEKRKAKQSEFISRNIQWYYFVGDESVPYENELNVLIETGLMDGMESVQITKDGVLCEIDFKAKTEKNLRSGLVQVIARKQSADANSEICLPAHWDPQPPGQLVHLTTLRARSAEYEEVLNHFTSKGGTYSQIIKIERIQNPGLYKAYLVKKQTYNGAENEMKLFHGTSGSNIVPINANNFNRNFAGINGTKWGNGVYFARNASYSLRYCAPDSNGHRHIYVARVLVGKVTIGARGLKAPPSRNDPDNPGLLYDSVVNNVRDPSIFVIFLDHQCYPEYLITFTS